MGIVAVVAQSELRAGRLLADEEVIAGILAALLKDLVCDWNAPDFGHILSADILLRLLHRSERENGARGFISVNSTINVKLRVLRKERSGRQDESKESDWI